MTTTAARQNEKMTFTAKCSGYGSAQRSAHAPFETGYVSFIANNGEEFYWFNEKANWDRPFKSGQLYSITATVTPQNTIQRPTIKHL